MRRWSHVGTHDPRKERFLRRPSGSEVSGENWPVAGSNIPEEPVSSGDEAGGGEVLAGGSEEPVSVGWAELSVLVEVSGGKELVVSGGVSSPEPAPEPSPEPSSGGVVSEGGVLVEFDSDVELVMVEQLYVDVRFRLEKSVPFMLAIRPGRSLGETRHVVVVVFVLALSVIFEIDEGSVRFGLFSPETPVEFESKARHACGGVGMSL